MDTVMYAAERKVSPSSSINSRNYFYYIYKTFEQKDRDCG